MKLRIPLQRQKVPGGDVYEPAATGLRPFDPAAAALDPELLKKYSPDAQTLVGELSARGHFVGSPDGKLYAYVETEGDDIPKGTAQIRVCDVRTGRRLAAAIVKAPVGKLKFAKEGVAIEFEDGTTIAFSTEHGTEDDLEPKTPSEPSPEASPPAGSQTMNLLRERLRLQFEALSAGNATIEAALAACHDLAKAEGTSGKAEQLARLEGLMRIAEARFRAGEATRAELLAVQAAYEAGKSSAASTEALDRRE